jgi:hypothetical protein
MQASSPAMQKIYEICREKKVHNDTLNITIFMSVPKPKPKHNLSKSSHTLHRSLTTYQTVDTFIMNGSD